MLLLILYTKFLKKQQKKKGGNLTPRKSKEQLQREARTKAKIKYESKTYKKILLRLHTAKDADIIEDLEKVPSKNAYIISKLRQK